MAQGYNAAVNNTTGSNWMAQGVYAGYSNTTGANWVAQGAYAGYDITTGGSFVIIGYNTGRGVTTGSGNTIIGANVEGLPATLINTVILASGDGVHKIFADSTGLKVGTNSSDSRIKLTSPNGTVHTFAVDDTGVLYKV